MKTKKIIGAVAAIVMSAMFAAGLAACDGGNGNGGGNVDLTEESWAAAFELGTQYSLKEVIEDEDIGGMSVNVDVDGDKTYIDISADNAFHNRVYVEKDGEKLYLYSTTYEYWIKAETTPELVELMGYDDIVDDMLTTFPFGKFEKGTNAGEYVSKEDYVIQSPDGEGGTVETTVSDATLKFANGRIVSTVYKIEGQSCEVTFEYGKTVTLPEVLEGEQVTQEEWTSALAMTSTNYRMNTSMLGVTVAQFKQDGMKKQFSTVTEELDGAMQDYYTSKEGDAYFQYFHYYGHWMKQATDYSNDEEYAGYNGFTAMEIYLGEYNFKDFTYDETAKAYTLFGEGTSVTAIFKDKKLVWANMAQGFMPYTVEIVYGDAEVTLPTVPEGEQVSDAEWTAAMALNYDNIEIYTDAYNIGLATYRKEGTTIYQKLERGETVEEEVYLTIEGGKYYRFEVVEGVWTKTEIEKADYDEYIPTHVLSPMDKANFTWNAESASYMGTSGNDNYLVQFVDKKLYVASCEEKRDMFFSYGTVKLTVPEEGSPANGEGGFIGGNIEIG